METMNPTIELHDWSTIEQLCDLYLAGRPTRAILETLRPLTQTRPEVRDFLRRALRLIGISRLELRSFSPFAAFAMVMAKDFLPGAWGGRIPPITAPGRHRAIDSYIAATRPRFEGNPLMLDLGCGFPPTTAVESARRLPEWQIIGADPSFDPYVLYDQDQTYACIDQSGGIRYFQVQPGANIRTMEDYLRARDRLPGLFADLLRKLSPDNGEMCTVEVDGARLIRWPLKQWESANLRLMPEGIGSSSLPKADVIRCFNVLMYYDNSFLREFENWAASQLRDGGLVLAGSNSPNGTEAYYSVYRKESGRLTETEFAFSIDVARPLGLMPWFTLHDDYATALRLAGLIRRLRSDAEFRTTFDQRMDELLRESGLLIRDANGCLTLLPQPMPFEKMSQALAALPGQMEREDFAEAAAEALKRQGLRAWRNEVGHVAVDPAEL